MGWYFTFFFISGCCSVLYELIWLRLAMAEFGVTTAMVSIVLSVFMAGLGMGSWVAGEWLRRRGATFRGSALLLYGLVELLIGVSGIVVPYELSLGRRVVAGLGLYSSLSYYSASGLWTACALVPWCALMGATIPIGMRAIAQMHPREAGRSFSYLYMANVAGAVMGTALPLFLIELMGFHATLRVGAACNLLIAVSAISLSWQAPREDAAEPAQSVSQPSTRIEGERLWLTLLFLTGLTSMGMEVVWVRQLTPYLGTVVYAFASILAVYLAATFVGSRLYRYWSQKHARESLLLWTLLAFFALIPLVAANPDAHVSKAVRLVLGIAPFTGLLGFITPMLVDRFSRGNPSKAGSAYATNVAGCILGPLVAGFVLLPYISERWALVVLAMPWVILGLRGLDWRSTLSLKERVAAYALLPLALVLIVAGRQYQDRYHGRRVLRDSTATVIATGTGMEKRLLVNGYGITTLTPVTKMMAHLPMAFLDHPPQDGLVVCFGMGTTFRSMRSWGIPVTVVELVPSVPRLFGYFHSDGPEILDSPLADVVIDDGRRYLDRTPKQFDVITIDPPPPVEAAGSSLLYSQEFYVVARQRLRPGGILQQFLPYGDKEDFAAVASALRNSFPYVRAFRWSDDWGFHFLASDRPLPDHTAQELTQKLPASAAADFVEWGPAGDAEGQFALVVDKEIPVDSLISPAPSTPALSDDRPINEYYVLRWWLRNMSR